MDTINSNSLKEETDSVSPLFTELNLQEANTAKGGCGFQGGRNKKNGYGGLFSGGLFQLFAMVKNSFNTRNYSGQYQVTALNQANIGDNNNIYIL